MGLMPAHAYSSFSLPFLSLGTVGNDKVRVGDPLAYETPEAQSMVGCPEPQPCLHHIGDSIHSRARPYCIKGFEGYVIYNACFDDVDPVRLTLQAKLLNCILTLVWKA